VEELGLEEVDERGLTPRKGVMILVEVEEGVASEGGDGTRQAGLGEEDSEGVDGRYKVVRSRSCSGIFPLQQSPRRIN